MHFWLAPGNEQATRCVAFAMYLVCCELATSVISRVASATESIASRRCMAAHAFRADDPTTTLAKCRFADYMQQVAAPGIPV